MDPKNDQAVALEVNAALEEIEVFRNAFINANQVVVNEMKQLETSTPNVEWVGWVDLKDPKKPIDGFRVNLAMLVRGRLYHHPRTR